MAGWTDETIAAYVAAFVDCDGSIGIYKNGAKAKTYRLRIGLYNNQMAPLRFLQKHCGGTIHTRPAGHGRLGKHPHHTLVWQARKSAEILRRILPYMIGKHAQGELALRFREHQESEGYNNHLDKAWQLGFYEQMKRLNNHKGE